MKVINISKLRNKLEKAKKELADLEKDTEKQSADVKMLQRERKEYIVNLKKEINKIGDSSMGKKQKWNLDSHGLIMQFLYGLPYLF